MFLMVTPTPRILFFLSFVSNVYYGRGSRIVKSYSLTSWPESPQKGVCLVNVAPLKQNEHGCPHTPYFRIES